MERFKGDVKDTDRILDFISQNAMGNIVILDGTPTTDNLKANTMAFYNNELYMRLSNGTLYKFALTVV